MFREALRLLRRSKGERVGTLQIRLFAFFALFAIVLVGACFLLLAVTGVMGSAEKRQLAWMDAEIRHLHSAASDTYGRLSQRGVEFAESLASAISEWSRENGIAEKEIGDHPELLESLLSEQAERLIGVLGNNACSGVFLVLDATVRTGAENDGSSKAGLYFKRTDYNATSVASKFHCLRGPASIARANGLEIMGQWRMEFYVRGADFYERVMATASENNGLDLSRLYHWSERYLMEGDSEHAMRLCIPLRAKDGAVYGLCGIEMSSMMFKSLYTPSGTEYPRAFAVFAPIREESFETGAGLVAGNTYLTSQTTGTLTSETRHKSLAVWRSDDGNTYTGQTETLRLHPGGSPYEEELWALALLMPSADWDGAAGQDDAIVYTLILALLAASLLLAVFISRRYIRPVVSALDSIKLEERNSIPKKQIAEIDDLVEYLDALDRERRTLGEEKENLMAELEQAKLRAQEQGASSAAYERFKENLKTLTATEQAVFNLYIKNYTAQEIANALFITKRTVKFHNTNLYAKLGVSSLKELMVYVNMAAGIKDDESKSRL
jgi:DNA-binding CsgD family transcriptional regulator